MMPSKGATAIVEEMHLSYRQRNGPNARCGE
jgi:hypothetical protein